MIARSALLLPVALLAACERKAEDPSSANGTGTNVKLETPGLKADINLPFMDALGDKMEVDGVKLFPGSKVAGVNVNAMSKDAGRVSLRFEAPAERAKVAEWFGKQFAANGTTARPTPTGFAGETKDGAWFTLDLTDAGERTQGEFKIGEKQR